MGPRRGLAPKCRGCSTSANSTSDNSTSANWPKSKKSRLAEVEIGRSQTDGVCSVSSFSLFLFFSFALFLLFFTFFLFLLISLFILFLCSFCFRPQKPALNPKPRTLHPISDGPFRWTPPPPCPPPPDNPPPDNPPLVRPTFRSFFSLFGVFSWNFVGVFEGRGPEMCTFGLSGCRVKPWRPHQTGPPGLAHDKKEERKLWRRREKKARNFGPPTLRGSTLRGSTLRGSTLRGSTLRGSTLRGSTLRGSTLLGSTLVSHVESSAQLLIFHLHPSDVGITSSSQGTPARRLAALAHKLWCASSNPLVGNCASNWATFALNRITSSIGSPTSCAGVELLTRFPARDDCASPEPSPTLQPLDEFVQ